jgi:hypothetical protein
MWWQGKDLYGKVLIAEETDAGRTLKGLLKAGFMLGISSRGVGSVKSVGGKDVVQEDFELIAFDFVSSPSTPGAYLFKEGKEMGRRGMIPLKDAICFLFQLSQITLLIVLIGNHDSLNNSNFYSFFYEKYCNGFN